MVLMQLLTIMILVGTTMVGGSILLRIAYNQYATKDTYWASVTVIGLACLIFAIVASIHFYEPFLNEVGSLL